MAASVRGGVRPPWLIDYALDIYNADTRTLVYSRNLGKPAVGDNWLIAVDVDETVKGLPLANTRLS